jgi:Flp pilus assembly protein TadB
MGNILYLVAAVLVICWLIGFVGYSAGGLIHVLLILAVISILVEVNSNRRKEFDN